MDLPLTSRRLIGGGILSVLLGTTAAHGLDGVPEYHVTRLGDMILEVFPGVEYPLSLAYGLNEDGDVVGEASTGGNQMQAWVYTVEHGVVALPLVDGHTSSVALDVSDHDENGEIVIIGGGVPNVYMDLWLGEAALWRFSTVTGAVLETRTIGVLPGFTESIAVAVNNSGTVVGFCELTGPWSPFKYDVGTEVLEAFDFPVRPRALNNLGQIVGGRYAGDLVGNFVDLGIAPGCTSSVLEGINDLGWVTGRGGRPWTDGAGRFMASVTRLSDEGWLVLEAITPWDTGFDLNIHGDITAGIGPGWSSRLYVDATGVFVPVDDLLTGADFLEVHPEYGYAMNDAGQIAASSGHAILLTPLGEMIIPGDVNGDAVVDLADLCAWLVEPINLDGDADADDEAWLVERLAVFGFEVVDCNGNGISDFCDIAGAVSQDCDEDGVPDECQSDCSGDGVPDACEPDCNANGIPDPCDIAEGTSQDCNGNGIPDECDVAGGVVEALDVLDPPRDLFQSSTITEEMLVTEAGTIDDLDVRLDVGYRVGELTIRISHGATTITVVDRPGHPEWYGGYGHLGLYVTLDDEASGGPLESAGEMAVFEPLTSPPSYTPTETLSAFDGMDMQGVWTVEIHTEVWGSPIREFYGWGLTFTRATVPVEPCACAADLDGSGDVGFADIVALLGSWGECPAECPADLDGNGSVDFIDIRLDARVVGLLPVGPPR